MNLDLNMAQRIPNWLSQLRTSERIWLLFDGTISSLVIAAAGEGLSVDAVQPQRLVSFEDAKPNLTQWLMDRPEHLLQRSIIRRGERSGRTYYYAESITDVASLPPGVQDQLLEGSEPIHQILDENGLDRTYVVVAYDRRPLGELGAFFGLEPDTLGLQHTFRVMHRRHTIMIISEVFPEGTLPL